MSSQKNNISCAFCHAYLFEEDDVVYCPTCGAPHHRECYNKIGHCALEELHGTENQYDLLKKKQQEKETAEAEGKESYKDNQTPPPPFNTPFGNPIYIDFLGGVPKDFNLDEDVTADEAKNFVLSNTMRYIPKFAKFKEGGKISWNFLAFLFPCGWFLSRKMYKKGIITGILSIISTLLTVPFMNSLVAVEGATYYEILEQSLPNITPAVLAVFFAGSLLNFIIRIICGIFGDYWYKNHVISTIKNIKEKSEDLQNDFRKKGGVNLILFFVGTMAVQYIPLFIIPYL